MAGKFFWTAVVAGSVTLGGALFYLWGEGELPAEDGHVRAASEQAAPTDETEGDPHDRALRTRFNQAVVMLHAKRYEEAVAALHKVLELAPEMPEAHVNMGFALLGMEKPDAAADFFKSAIALNGEQANAYYGLALALEAAGDLELALGAMRTYVHRTRADDPWLRKARAALWEWETRLRGEVPPEVPANQLQDPQADTPDTPAGDPASP